MQVSSLEQPLFMGGAGGAEFDHSLTHKTLFPNPFVGNAQWEMSKMRFHFYCGGLCLSFLGHCFDCLLTTTWQHFECSGDDVGVYF